MNKIIKLLIITLFLTNIYADELTKSCKDYKHIQCLEDGWKFEDDDQKDALKFYVDALKEYKENNFIDAYKNIKEAIDIIPNSQTMKTKMKKRTLSGSSLIPKPKTYHTSIKNKYEVQLAEENIAKQITAQPILIVECTGDNTKKDEIYKKNIYVYNINKSFDDISKIKNMNLKDIQININKNEYKISKVKSGSYKKMQAKSTKCQNLNTSLNAYNSMFNKKSLKKIDLK